MLKSLLEPFDSSIIGGANFFVYGNLCFCFSKYWSQNSLGLYKWWFQICFRYRSLLQNSFTSFWIHGKTQYLVETGFILDRWFGYSFSLNNLWILFKMKNIILIVADHQSNILVIGLQKMFIPNCNLIFHVFRLFCDGYQINYIVYQWRLEQLGDWSNFVSLSYSQLSNKSSIASSCLFEHKAHPNFSVPDKICQH